MMKGWNYVIRLLKGENPADVINSLAENDYKQLEEAVGGLGSTNLPRQQRRAIQRKFQKVKR